MNYIDELATKIYRGSEQCEPDPNELPLYRIYAVLALVKGEAVTEEDVHDAWSAYTTGTRPDNRYLVPFSELSTDVQRRDWPYVEAIRWVARERVAGNGP